MIPFKISTNTIFLQNFEEATTPTNTHLNILLKLIVCADENRVIKSLEFPNCKILKYIQCRREFLVSGYHYEKW